MYRARYRRIIWFFARLIASLLFYDVFLPRVGFSDWSIRTRSVRWVNAATRFRKLAVGMGGVMIKVGQFLSTRVDILPKEVINELSGLQDEVPPVPYEAIRKVIEAEFNHPLADVFTSFNSVPLAAASLGQVHQATILLRPAPEVDIVGGNGHTGKAEISSVVVKVQRPDIEKLIATDLEAVRTVGGWLQHYKPIRKRVNIPALLNEFSRILYEEIDYLAEGRNAEKFAENFANQPKVRVPKVYWSYTTTRVLTLENVMAIKINDYQAISAAKINRTEVASLLVDTYLQQIFEDGFFHADPHPGNLFVEPSPEPVKIPVGIPAGAKMGAGNGSNGTVANIRWQITFVDFGMVGHVPDNLRNGLRELLIGVGTRDSERVVRAYQQMGILLPGVDMFMLERANSRVFDRYWGMNMTELTNLNTSDFLEFADEFRDLIYDMPFQIPQDVIFLVRCVSILSGICTGLDPQFNIFQHLNPYAQKILRQEALNNRKDWLNEIEGIARNWISLPVKIDALLTRFERGNIMMRDPEVAQQVNRLDRTMRMLGLSLVFIALLLGGIQLYLGHALVLAGILFAGAFITLLWIFWKNVTS